MGSNLKDSIEEFNAFLDRQDIDQQLDSSISHKRVQSQDEGLQSFGDISLFQNNYYLGGLKQTEPFEKRAQNSMSSTTSKLAIVIDNLTMKRNTLYDKAKLKVYLEQCRINKKKAEFDSVVVKEDEL